MKKGVFYAASAYLLWGFFPIFFKALQAVPAIQVVGHRVVWSCLLLLLVVIIRRESIAFMRSATLRRILVYLGAGALLAVNWLIYVWAVNAGLIIETSLGYFISPLVSVLLGMIFLKERLRPWQWAPVGLAVVGVAYLTFNYGSLPWIALALASTFSLYGLVKKIAPLNSLHGLTLETATIFPIAMGFLLVEEARGVGAFAHIGAGTTLLLALTGVITAVPLLLFSMGARSVPLTTIGLLQYISPTMQFLFGVFLFGEPFTPVRVVGFSAIWLALLVFYAENYLNRRRELVTARA